MEDFNKFPRTRHLFDAGGTGVSRDDLLLTEKDAKALFYSGQTVYVEEKVDGANLGFSIAPDGKILAQNRSHYVNAKSHAQFKRLDAWISQHMGDLYEILEEPGKYILFGEWLYATHSVEYTSLPSYFLAFDIFDIAKQQFLSRKSFYAKLEGTSISHVPLIATCQLGAEEDARALLENTSAYAAGVIEGIYLRVDQDNVAAAETTADEDIDIDGDDEEEHRELTSLAYRAKVVRPDFLQGITSHWVSHTLRRNQLAEGVFE